MDRGLLSSLVATASTSASTDRRPLALLADRCWPRPADGTAPAAVEWVRRWGPRAVVVTPPECACVAGRCGTCN
jgi:hypothetical protein